MQGLRLGGHPLHPALVHFPLVCWTAAPLMDLLQWSVGGTLWWRGTYWLIAVGVVMALPAMAAGFMDLISLPREHPAQITGQRHMMLMGSAWSVFMIDLLLRSPAAAPQGVAAALGLGLSLLGFVILLAGAYAGAQLVYGFGVGQNPRHGDTSLR